MMAMHSFEFIFGSACVALGVLLLVLRQFLGSRRREAVREADELLAKDGFPAVTVLGMILGVGVAMVVVGVLVVTASVIAYADP